ncbi:hypothetical protein [Lentilactobacillus kosonis]|uniref:Uncharacterized protein n=1 Tax=Lentilactobacillus kosonis TaxID=2810561 RepID=A0A401FJM7_9LACO|nr:hypothetical protein [Lentilactobacillus kosonis]GAY72441.1 hypothetical protein NBRC111893_587 [Lentilactobacillus kosonis]
MDSEAKQLIDMHDQQLKHSEAWLDKTPFNRNDPKGEQTQGAIKANSPMNVALFLEHDPKLKGAVAFDSFSNVVLVKTPMKR